MIYEAHDNKAEAKAYYEDLRQQSEQERLEQVQQARNAWAQRHGNDSGFDPYAGLE